MSAVAPLSALIADDEAVARAGLARLLADVPWIRVIGEAANGPEAVAAIDTLRPELVFLDIQMPGLIGTEVVRQIRHRPQVVFTTAYAQHAVAAFELGALDYLLTREEVDPQQLGVTGLSGGGTQTAWLMALEDRWTMAAPACFITTLQHNADNELPADSEQCPPNFLKLRLDHSDCIAAMAPRPVILLAQEKDFFDVRGTVSAFAGGGKG